MHIVSCINSIFSNTQLKKHTEEYKNILSRQKTIKEVDRDLKKNTFIQSHNKQIRYPKTNYHQNQIQTKEVQSSKT